MNNDNVIITRSQSKKRNIESDNINLDKITNISTIILTSVLDNIINNLNKKIKLSKLEHEEEELEDEFDPEEEFDPTYDPNENNPDIELEIIDDDDDDDIKNFTKETQKFLNDNINFKETIFINYSKEEKTYFNTLILSQKENIYNNEVKVLDELGEPQPYRFKILNLDIDFYTKNLILKKLKQLDDYGSGSEYAKYKSWIDEFLLLPINKYNQLPISLNDTNENKINYLKSSKDILDLSIYGHKQPKDNILRIIDINRDLYNCTLSKNQNE